MLLSQASPVEFKRTYLQVSNFIALHSLIFSCSREDLARLLAQDWSRHEAYCTVSACSGWGRGEADSGCHSRQNCCHLPPACHMTHVLLTSGSSSSTLLPPQGKSPLGLFQLLLVCTWSCTCQASHSLGQTSPSLDKNVAIICFNTV